MHDDVELRPDTDQPGIHQELCNSLVADRLGKADSYARSNGYEVAAAEPREATSSCLALDWIPLTGPQLLLLSHTPLTLRELVSGTQPACQLCNPAAAGTKSCKHKSFTVLMA